MGRSRRRRLPRYHRPGPLDKERGRICRKAADYMLPIDGVTRQGQPSDGVGAGPVRSGPATRVILDTNTVLDWLVFGDASAAAVGAAIEQGHLQWLVTPRMLDELRAVLATPLALRWEASRELALTIDVTRLAIVCTE